MNKNPVLIILAGGKSSRMGTPKGLLDYKGDYWILEQISRYRSIDYPEVIVGLGHDSESYLDKITWFKNALNKSYTYRGVEVKVVINPTPEKGKFSTLVHVLKKVEIGKDVLILPVDVPLLTSVELKKVIEVNSGIVLPRCNNDNGHPVKIAASIWSTFFKVPLKNKEARLDFLIKKFKLNITLVDVLDNSVNQNINTLKKWSDYLYQRAL